MAVKTIIDERGIIQQYSSTGAGCDIKGLTASGDGITGVVKTATSVTTKIMFVGDSIVYGAGGSTALPGFREHVWEQLRKSRGNISFIGTIVDGSGAGSKYVLGEWEHEGKSGDKIEDRTSVISAHIATTGVPDIVSLMIGTNNCGTDSAATMATKLGTLIDTIIAAAPNAKILVHDIPPFSLGSDAAKQTVRNAYIALIPNVVATRPACTYVPVCTTMTLADQNTDGIHPTHLGNAKIAASLTPAIDRLLPMRDGLSYPRAFRARPAQSSLSLGVNTDVATVTKSTLEPTNKNFYVEFWYKPSSIPAGNNCLVSYGTGLSDGYIVAQNGDGISIFIAGSPLLISSAMPGSLKVGAWHHIVAHLDATNLRASVFVNGMLRGTYNPIVAWNFSTGMVTRVGNFNGVATGALGLFDGLRIGIGAGVPSYKLMRDQVERAYFEGVAIDGLVGQFKFDEGSGSSAADTFGGTSMALTGATLTGSFAKPCDLTDAGSQLHPNAATAVSVVTTASTQTTPFGFSTQAQADAIVANLNALIVDVAALRLRLSRYE